MAEDITHAKKRKKLAASSSKPKKAKSAAEKPKKDHIVYHGKTIPYPKPDRQFNDNSEQLYCVCRSIDNGELMVWCNSCNDWYHFSCLHLDKRQEKLYYKFYCPYCELSDPEAHRTLYEKKCLLKSCYLPIAVNSKFCSEAHGINYFEGLKRKMLEKNKREKGGINGGGVLSQSEVAQIVHAKGITFDKFKTLGDELPQPSEKEFVEFIEANDTRDDYAKELQRHNHELQEVKRESNFYKLKYDYLNSIRDKVKKINDYFASTLLEAPSEQAPKGGKSKSKGKKNASKKFEICGYDRLLSQTLLGWKKYLVSDDSGSREVFKCAGDAEQTASFEQVEVANEQWFTENLDRLKQVFPTVDSIREAQDDIAVSGEAKLENVFSNICLLEKKKCQKHLGWQSRINDELLIRMNELANTEAEIVGAKKQLRRQYVVEYWDSREI